MKGKQQCLTPATQFDDDGNSSHCPNLLSTVRKTSAIPKRCNLKDSNVFTFFLWYRLQKSFAT